VSLASALLVRSVGAKANLLLKVGSGYCQFCCRLIWNSYGVGVFHCKYADLAEGDAHVIRNAGGRASDDAIRSLVISYKLLGTREFFVIHHTNCGMEFFSNDVMRELPASSLETAELSPKGFRDVGSGPGSRAGNTSSG
jgi:hypothetical protein